MCVTALIPEARTQQIHVWLLQQPPGTPVAISDWVFAEFASALAKKQREGLLSHRQRTEAQIQFSEAFKEAVHLPISHLDFREAGRLVSVRNVNLRTADALHLAICRSGSAVPCTRDRRLAEAGRLVGITTLLL